MRRLREGAQTTLGLGERRRHIAVPGTAGQTLRPPPIPRPCRCTQVLLYDSDGDVDEAYAVGMCSDYDTCPDSGTSGIAEYGPKTAKGESRFDMRVATTKPGTVGRNNGAVSPFNPLEEKTCSPGATTRDSATGVYDDDDAVRSGIRAGMPFRYVMPKFICFTHPADVDHFEVELSVRCLSPVPADSRVATHT